jgi:transcription initiation factor IIE alpha subunit
VVQMVLFNLYHKKHTIYTQQRERMSNILATTP